MSGNKVASRKWVEEQIGNLSAIDAAIKKNWMVLRKKQQQTKRQQKSKLLMKAMMIQMPLPMQTKHC